MAAVPLLLLLSFGALFFSANAQDAYEKLPEDYKKGVDLALEKLNALSGIQSHFLFFRSLAQSNIEVFVILACVVMVIRIKVDNLFDCRVILM